MDKIQTLEAIENARNSHLSQMEKITAVINGEKVNNPTAVSKTQCTFGKWLYSDENNLKHILGALFYNNLETMHAKWHNEYVKLFDIFFKDEKKGFFSKLVGANKIDPMDVDKAKLYFSELESTTAELLKILASCERRITALSESKFH